MKVIFHRVFEKQYQKLRNSKQTRFNKHLRLFIKNQFDPLLNNHSLRGKYKGYRSINIGGDLRAIYRLIKNDIVVFVTINTHSKLYS